MQHSSPSTACNFRARLSSRLLLAQTFAFIPLLSLLAIIIPLREFLLPSSLFFFFISFSFSTISLFSSFPSLLFSMFYLFPFCICSICFSSFFSYHLLCQFRLSSSCRCDLILLSILMLFIRFLFLPFIALTNFQTPSVYPYVDSSSLL